ncbi:MAG: hypothetical protein JWO03_1122 [Bacteroidetes bacterium]|nr:hypothetical protein [Bacteroidota bacterium]
MRVIMAPVEPVDHITANGLVMRYQGFITCTSMEEQLCCKEFDEVFPEVRSEACREEMIRYAYFVFDETIYEGVEYF